MPIDWTDKRPIDTLRFGAEWKPTIGDLQAAQPGFGAEGAVFPLRPGDPPSDEVIAAWKEMHAVDLTVLRELLDAAGCKIAEDVVALGCTGFVHKLRNDKLVLEALIAQVQHVRLGLGGSGVGLPCYVPPNRYCLVHQVSGGLQDRQEQKYPEEVEAISRELTAAERAQTELTDHARQSSGENRERGAADVLAGRRLPEGWERETGPITEEQRAKNIKEYMDRTGITAKVDAAAAEIAAQQWKCPDHTEPRWDCRYCVAQMIVEGPLAPSYLFARRRADGAQTVVDLPADALGPTLADAQQDASVIAVEVHVLVARYERKLTRVA